MLLTAALQSSTMTAARLTQIVACALASALSVMPSSAQFLHPVAIPDNSIAAPPGGNGDSYLPLISPDGRFVLFSSVAENLASAGTNTSPLANAAPASLNVYMRDRSQGTTVLVSVNASGTGGGNEDSVALGLSTNGQVLFQSAASDLVPGDTNGAVDVFVRDLVNRTTTLISASTNGMPGNGASHSAVFTPDGHYAAFVSEANNLVATDTNGIPDVFVRDLVSGTTICASVGAASTNTSIPVGGPEAPEISVDGRYVAFFSSATNLVSGVPRGGDIYVRDLVAGTTSWASSGARPAAAVSLGKTNVTSYNLRLSADGHWVVYETSLPYQSGPANSGLILRFNVDSGVTDVVYTNAQVQSTAYEDARSIDLTPDGRFVAFVANTNGLSGETTCLQIWDGQDGSLQLASSDATGFVPTNSTCHWPTLDSAGQFVTFLSNASGLVSNSLPGDFHLYQHDLHSGLTVLIDDGTNGQFSSLGWETSPSISADGRFIAFHCREAHLVPNENDHSSQVFVRDTLQGSNELISVHNSAWASLTPNGASVATANSMSSDGRWLAFSSEADDLVTGDTNACRDVFVRDLAFGTNVLVSVGTNDLSGNGVSLEPVLTGDGRYVAFTSIADNLVPGDTNQTQDVFIRDLQSGTTTLESRDSSGLGIGNGPSSSPRISNDARFLLFRSWAKNLTAGSFSYENLFLRDRMAGTNVALTSHGTGPATMTADGRFVAFAALSSTFTAVSLYVWNSEAGTMLYANPGVNISPLTSLAIQADGKRVAFGVSNGVYVLNLGPATNELTLLNADAFSYQQLRFSRDGQYVTYVAKPVTNGPTQVYCLSLSGGGPILVSHKVSSSSPATDASDSPDISSAGRFIAYRSSSADLVQGTGHTNGTSSLFLFDRLTGNNSLLSAVLSANDYANDRSFMPVFCADGQTLYFTSWASDLANRDFNRSSDLFAFTLFSAFIVPGNSAGAGNTISWPYLSGKNYRVQFKNNLNDPAWQNFDGTITNFANRAWLTDPAPMSQKFYRVTTF